MSLAFDPRGPVIVENDRLRAVLVPAFRHIVFVGPRVTYARYVVAASVDLATRALDGFLPLALDSHSEPHRRWLEDAGLLHLGFSGTGELVERLRRDLDTMDVSRILDRPLPGGSHPVERLWLTGLRRNVEAEVISRADATRHRENHVARLTGELEAALAQVEPLQEHIRGLDEHIRELDEHIRELEGMRALRLQRRMSDLRHRRRRQERSGTTRPSVSSGHTTPVVLESPTATMSTRQATPIVCIFGAEAREADDASPPRIDLLCAEPPDPAVLGKLPVTVHVCAAIAARPPGSSDWVAFLSPGAHLRADGLREAAGLAVADIDAVITPDVASSGRIAPRNAWSPAEGRFWTPTRGLCLIRRTLIEATGGLDEGQGWSAPTTALLRARDARVIVSAVPGCQWIATRSGADGQPSPRGGSALPSRRTASERTPLATLIVPTRDQPHHLATVLSGIRRTRGVPLEVILVDNGTVDPRARRLLDASTHRVIRSPGAFNFARLVNRAAAAARGEFLVLLNNDVELRNGDWLRALTAALSDDRVGVAGSVLSYPSGALQHAGLAIHRGGVIVPCRGLAAHAVPPEIRAVPARRTAVTGAVLATPRTLFEELGGLDMLFASDYNDVDYCLRAAARGAMTVCTPTPGLIHHESVTRGTEAGPTVVADWEFFKARWQHVLDVPDPYWPRLSWDFIASIGAPSMTESPAHFAR